MIGLCGAGQKKGRRQSAYLSSTGKGSSLNDKTKLKEEKNKKKKSLRVHITDTAYITGHDGRGQYEKL